MAASGSKSLGPLEKDASIDTCSPVSPPLQGEKPGPSSTGVGVFLCDAAVAEGKHCDGKLVEEAPSGNTTSAPRRSVVSSGAREAFFR